MPGVNHKRMIRNCSSRRFTLLPFSSAYLFLDLSVCVWLLLVFSKGQGDIAVFDTGRKLIGQIAAEFFGHGDRAVLSAGAAYRNGVARASSTLSHRGQVPDKLAHLAIKLER
jgi:hypothetical protein